jgi:NADH-quinone oxidoreductase subunit J
MHLAAPVLAVTAPDAITFAVSALAILAGALGVVLSRNPVHSALMLVMTLFGVAILFVEQQAQFLAAVQVIVYAGAIVVLFLFVIMLLGVDRRESLAAEPLRGQRPLAVVLGLVTLAEVLALARVHTWATGAPAVAGSSTGPGSNVAKLAKSIFTTYLLPFEATSALLVIAVVGAVLLSRRSPDPTSEEEEAGPPERPRGQEGAEAEPERDRPVEPEEAGGEAEAGPSRAAEDIGEPVSSRGGRP